MSALSLLALGFAACSDNDSDETQIPPPTVALEAVGEAAPDSFVFRLTPSDADRAVWLVRESSEPAPDASRLLAEGSAVAADKASELTAEALRPATSYTVYAVAAKGETVGRVARLDVTTATATPERPIRLGEVGKNAISYHVEMPAEESYLHVCMMKRDVLAFTSMSETDEQIEAAYRLILQLYGASGKGPGDYRYEDGQKMPNGPDAKVLAGMEYEVIVCRTDAEMNFLAPCEKAEVTTTEPDRLTQTIAVEIVELKAGEVTFRITPEAGIDNCFETTLPASVAAEIEATGDRALLEYVFGSGSRVSDFSTPSVWTSLDPESPYIHYVVGVDAAGDQTELFVKEFVTPAPQAIVTENLLFDRLVSAYYYGKVEDESGAEVYNYYLELADCEVAEDPEYGDIYPADGGAGNVLMCDFYSATGGIDALPEGTYSIGNTSAAGTLGYDYTWAAAYDEEGNLTQLSFESGTIVVAREGADYRLTMNFVTEDDRTYTGTYTGPIVFEDVSTPNAVGATSASRAGRPVRKRVLSGR